MSSTTGPGSRSAAEIEREVEQTRASLTGTLDKLRKRASPGQLFQPGLDYARSAMEGQPRQQAGTASTPEASSSATWSAVQPGSDHLT